MRLAECLMQVQAQIATLKFLTDRPAAVEQKQHLQTTLFPHFSPICVHSLLGTWLTVLSFLCCKSVCYHSNTLCVCCLLTLPLSNSFSMSSSLCAVTTEVHCSRASPSPSCPNSSMYCYLSSHTMKSNLIIALTLSELSTWVQFDIILLVFKTTSRPAPACLTDLVRLGTGLLSVSSGSVITVGAKAFTSAAPAIANDLPISIYLIVSQSCLKIYSLNSSSYCFRSVALLLNFVKHLAYNFCMKEAR